MSKYFLSFLSFAFTYAAAAQNVGIGTTIPAATLDVVGNVKITDGTQGAGKLLTSGADGTLPGKSRRRHVFFQHRPNGIKSQLCWIRFNKL